MSYTASRPGLQQGGSTNRELFLKLFAGKVLETFNTKTVFMDKHVTMSIPQGTSFRFPVVGRQGTWAYHAAGADVAPTAIAHQEREIVVDNKVLATTFIDVLDKAMNHFEIRNMYATECAQTLVRLADTRVAMSIARAARATSYLTEQDGGAGEINRKGSSGCVGTSAPSYDANLNVANTATDAGILANSIWYALRLFAEKDVPLDQIYCALRPAQYSLLLANPVSGKATLPVVIHRDVGGEGSLAKGEIVRLGGATIVQSNHIPSTDSTATSGYTSATTGGMAYGGDFTDTVALVWHPQAAATVKMLDLATEADYLIQNQGTMIVSKYAMGSGYLRPECAVEIADGTNATATSSLKLAS